MRRTGLFTLVLLLALGVTLDALAQQQPAAAPPMPAGRVSRVYTLKAKPGMEKQFEDGFKKHAAWHKAQKDTWTWNTWEIEAGPATGQYVVGTFGHQWEDFDKPVVSGEADAADYNANVAPYVESISGIIIVAMPEVSRWPTTPGPTALAEVLTFRVRGGAEDDFMHAIRKVTEAIKKTNWVANFEWYALAFGGEHPTFYLVIPHENWASFKAPEKTFKKMLEEALGPEEAGLLNKVFEKTILTESSEVVRLRTDLSYLPAK